MGCSRHLFRVWLLQKYFVLPLVVGLALNVLNAVGVGASDVEAVMGALSVLVISAVFSSAYVSQSMCRVVSDSHQSVVSVVSGGIASYAVARAGTAVVAAILVAAAFTVPYMIFLLAAQPQAFDLLSVATTVVGAVAVGVSLGLCGSHIVIPDRSARIVLLWGATTVAALWPRISPVVLIPSGGDGGSNLTAASAYLLIGIGGMAASVCVTWLCEWRR